MVVAGHFLYSNCRKHKSEAEVPSSGKNDGTPHIDKTGVARMQP